MSGDISIGAVQQKVVFHRKMEIAGALFTIAALTGAVVLTCLAIDHHMRMSNLNDLYKRLVDHGSSVPKLAAQIDDLTYAYNLELGFAVTLFVLSALGLGATAYQNVRKKEAQGKLPATHAQKEIDATSLETHRKKVKIAAAIATVALVVFLVLAFLALGNKIKINDGWDQWNREYSQYGNDWDDPNPELHDHIEHLKCVAWQELGFSFAFLAISLGAAAYAHHHHGKARALQTASATAAAKPDGL